MSERGSAGEYTESTEQGGIEPDDAGKARYELDGAGRFVGVSDRLLALTGWDRESLLGADLSLVLSDRDLDRYETAIEGLRTQAPLSETELCVRLRGPDDTSIGCTIQITALVGDTGDWRSLGVVTHYNTADETSQVDRSGDLSRQPTAELDVERATTEAILDSVADIVCLFDMERRLCRWNDQFDEITGYDEAELDGKPIYEFLPPSTHTMVESAIDRIAAGSVERTAVPLLTKDGTEIPYEFSAAPIYDEDGDVIGVATVGRDRSEQTAREQRLLEQNDRLERLNRINEVIRSIDQALVSAASRAEIETAVCERLVATDSYQCAWIGRKQRTAQVITPTAMAGQTDGQLDGRRIRTDSPPAQQGPVGRAYRTREIQVARDGDCAGTVACCGCDAIASVPVVYEETLYGVYTIYADDPSSFGDLEQSVLMELGEQIGHAISSLQAKRALLTERVTEITLRVCHDGFLFRLSERTDCSIRFEGSVFESADELLYYVTVDGTDAGGIRAVASGFAVDHLRIVSQADQACVLELQSQQPSLLNAVPDHGGSIQDLTISDGTGCLVIELPSENDVQQLLTTVRNRFDEVTLVSQCDSEQSVQTCHQFRDAITEALTDRQQAALEIAYYAEYFDWPRGSSGEDIADALNVSPPTFHKHLRLAEQKLVRALLDTPPSDWET